jgi:hypothetical protein
MAVIQPSMPPPATIMLRLIRFEIGCKSQSVGL